MGVPVITLYQGANREAFAQTDSFTLDYAYGDEENDFELSFTSSSVEPTRVTAFKLNDAPDVAGFVDTIDSTYKDGNYTIVLAGTSIQGVLDKRIIEPPAGQAYYTINGSLTSGLNTLLSRTQLSSLVRIKDVPARSVSFQFDRYTSVWNGLRKLAKSLNMRVQLDLADDNHIELSFTPLETTTISSENIHYEAKKTSRFTTHIIALGEGELTARAVGHAYWTGTQIVTSKPTGWQEGYTQTYEMNTISADKITDTAVEQLQKIVNELQSIEIKQPDGDYPLDCTFTLTDLPTGMTVSARISKLIIKISKGVKTLEVEVK